MERSISRQDSMKVKCVQGAKMCVLKFFLVLSTRIPKWVYEQERLNKQLPPPFSGPVSREVSALRFTVGPRAVQSKTAAQSQLE